MQKRLIIIGLELYAFLLAFLQTLGGVETDEAKYLLNIPYPHPPLARWFLSLTEVLPFQELFWRIIFATLLIQGVWFVYQLARDFTKEQRFALCGMWLFCAAVVLQAGTIMMAPLTAFQGLIFVWLYFRKASSLTKEQAGYVALFWLASLFTAYQAALFAPLIIAIFWKAPLRNTARAFAVFLPLVLLGVYTLSNPLIPASMLNAGSQNVSLGLEQIFHDLWTLWVLGGSLLLSFIGTWGLIKSRSWALILSFVLLLVYILLAARMYYAILFTPLFIAGVIAAPTVLRKTNFLLAIHILCSVYLIFQGMPSVTPSDAWRVMHSLGELEGEYVLLSGEFGHQWQYESLLPVRRFQTGLLDGAAAVVCIKSCSELSYFGWKQVENLSTEVWFRTDN